MDPELEKLTKNLEKSLKKGETAKISLAALSDVAQLLLILDAGLIDGAVVAMEYRVRLVAFSVEFARRCFDRATLVVAKKAARWIADLPVSSEAEDARLLTVGATRYGRQGWAEGQQRSLTPDPGDVLPALSSTRCSRWWQWPRRRSHGDIGYIHRRARVGDSRT